MAIKLICTEWRLVDGQRDRTIHWLPSDLE